MVIFIHFPWHALEEPEDVGLDDNRAFGSAIGQDNGHYIASSWYIVYFMCNEITLSTRTLEPVSFLLMIFFCALNRLYC